MLFNAKDKNFMRHDGRYISRNKQRTRRSARWDRSRNTAYRMQQRGRAIMLTDREWDHDILPRPAPEAVSPSIQAVLDFIETNFARSIALSELAALCGLSLYRFVTVFRSQVGIPPHQYVCRTRVRHARRLLRQGVPPAAVAIDTGFCDQSHMSRQFKRQCGVTPGLFASGRASAQKEATGRAAA